MSDFTSFSMTAKIANHIPMLRYRLILCRKDTFYSPNNFVIVDVDSQIVNHNNKKIVFKLFRDWQIPINPIYKSNFEHLRNYIDWKCSKGDLAGYPAPRLINE